MRSKFEMAARDVHDSVHKEFSEARSSIEDRVQSLDSPGGDAAMRPLDPANDWSRALPSAYKPPKKNWRLKRAAVPAWYKQRNGVRMHAQSGAARVARFRPRRSGSAI